MKIHLTQKIEDIWIVTSVILAFFLLSFSYIHFSSELVSNVEANSITTVEAETIKPATAPEAAPELATSSVPILMYHHVKEPNDPQGDKIDYGLSVPPNVFAQQMDSLRSHASHSMQLSDIFHAEESKDVVITFDDSYKDIFTNAFPIMKTRGLTGTVFVIVNSIGRDGYMSLEDLRILKEAGWVIGSHTLSHPDLGKASQAKARAEIFQSKLSLEQSLGTPIDTFCYPAGKYTDAVVNLVREAGYHYAVTTESSRINPKANVLTLRRYRVSGPDSVNAFNRRIFK